MFTSAKFYIIVGNNSLIIKKEGEYLEYIIPLKEFVPNVPCYYHLFDADKKEYIEDIARQIKKLKIKNATILFPDDSIDIEVDRRVLTEFFMLQGVKKVQENYQCFLLSLDNKRYISVSRTSRILVVQYIENNKCLSKKYYDKNYKDMEKIISDMRYLHEDCEYNMMPIYINNINNDMEAFESIGKLVSMQDIAANAMIQ